MKKATLDKYAEDMQIKKMYDSGISAYGIAKSLGRSKGYILKRVPELNFMSCQNIDKIVSLGESGHSIKVISQRTSTDHLSVVYHLRMNSLLKDDIDDLSVWLYESGNSFSAVSASTGISYERLSAVLKDRKIPVRLKQALPLAHPDFFNVIDTPEKAYWLGFMYADGNVSSDGKKVNLKLHSRDHDHIVKFITAVGWGGEVRQRLAVTNYGKYTFSYITIASSELNAGLVKSGCVPNRTTWARPPKLTGKLAVHFIRGLIDGDGTIVKRAGKVTGIKFYGVVELADWAAMQIPGGRVRQHSGQTWECQWNGIEFIRKIYGGSDEGIRLDRKYEDVKEVLDEMVISI